MLKKFVKVMGQALDGADLLVFSDFNYGCLPKPLVQQLVRIAKSRGVMVAAALIIVYAGVKFLQRHLLIRRLRSVRVDAPALRDLMQAGAALVVLDARSPTARRLDPRHIPGAIAINIGEAEKELRPNMHDHDIVVYCS